jgi:hypothetical protein
MTCVSVKNLIEKMGKTLNAGMKISLVMCSKEFTYLGDLILKKVAYTKGSDPRYMPLALAV